MTAPRLPQGPRPGTPLREADLPEVVARLNPACGLAGYAEHDPPGALVFLRAIAHTTRFPGLDLRPGERVLPGKDAWGRFLDGLRRDLQPTGPLVARGRPAVALAILKFSVLTLAALADALDDSDAAKGTT